MLKPIHMYDNFVKGFVVMDSKLPFSYITERLLSYSQFSLFSSVSSVLSQFQFHEFEKNGVRKKKILL